MDDLFEEVGELYSGEDEPLVLEEELELELDPDCSQELPLRF